MRKNYFEVRHPSFYVKNPCIFFSCVIYKFLTSPPPRVDRHIECNPILKPRLLALNLSRKIHPYCSHLHACDIRPKMLKLYNLQH